MDKSLYIARRAALGRAIGEGALAFIVGAQHKARNSDVHFPFRQDSNMLYLTGFNEPDTLLVILGGEAPLSIFFCAPKDYVKELWTGRRFGPAEAEEQFGFTRTYTNAPSEVVAIVATLLSHAHKIFIPQDAEQHCAIIPLREILEAHVKSSPDVCISDLNPLLGEQRLIKDAYELELMQKACTISASAHRDILRLVRPGMNERELEAEITYRFRKQGGDPLHAYQPIVASGAGACTLHYVENDKVMKDGDLVLVDAGCEYEGYASDITRTFPVNGKFSMPQRELYAIVLAAQHAAIAHARAGNTLAAVHMAAVMALGKGLAALGLIRECSRNIVLTIGSCKRFFPHGTSHFLGLDVHDAGGYQRNEQGANMRILERGMVITVEPGLYIPATPDIPEQYQNIGIRIEDDILITDGAAHVMSAHAPKAIDEIEAIMYRKK